MNVLVKLLRLRQWIKNLFMVFPLIFSGHYTQWNLWSNCCLAMAGFCLISSGMYIINDIVDIEEDRLHPRKKDRALASGKIRISTAGMIATLLLALGGLFCYGQGRYVFLLSMGYVLLHVFYNLRIKHLVILDVLTVASGFLIRVWAGACAVGGHIDFIAGTLQPGV